MAIDIRRRMSGHNRRGDLKNLVRSRTHSLAEKKTGRIIHAVTIKGIDKADGETVWEYGPGAFWRHHYGADAITGLVPDLAATLDKYAIAASDYPVFAQCGNRNSGSLEANAAEAMSLVKLNSLDGTTIEESVIPGFFCSEITEFSAVLIRGITVTNAAALSGGDFVIVGERLPIIEFIDFESNAATKEYILHAHGMIGGNVYLKTRTSSETIRIPYNATAGQVETLIEATSDCVSATATGGPWPLKPISLDVEWSVSSGDVSGIAVTSTQSAIGGGSTWSFTTGNVADGIDYLTLNVDSVSVGTTFRFYLAGGEDFEYVSTTDDVSAFLAAMDWAMEAFALDQADTGWMSIAVGIPDSILVSGSYLTIYYSTELGFDPVQVELTAGGSSTTDTRRVGSAAASYDTGSGEMVSSVGYVFGYSAVSPPSFIFSETASAPSVTGLNVLGIDSIGAGPSNSVVVTPFSRSAGDSIKANTVEVWTIAAGVWSQDWSKYCNATQLMQTIVQVESGYAICPIKAKRFDGVRDRTAAKLLISAGIVTEVNTTFGSITPPNNGVLTAMFDDDHSSYISYNYSIIYSSDKSAVFRINGHGADTWIDGTEFRIGSQVFAADASAVYSFHSSNSNVSFDFDAIGEFADHDVYMKFFATYGKRAAEPTQFRFIVTNMPGVNYTAWIDWYATQAEIEAALNALLGSGNCSIIDFGGLATPVANNPVALIECNPMIQFLTDSGYGPGSGFIPTGYLQYSLALGFRGGVTIETRNDTLFAEPGIAAYDNADATLIWTRPWGTRGGLPESTPLYAWLQGDFVYAYGVRVDNEL